MKEHILEFIRRGLSACGFGPMVLAIIYQALGRQGLIQNLTVKEVCCGIFSVTALAFIAGGINVIYQIERLPLSMAILIHGVVLYLSYFGTYLMNGWFRGKSGSMLIFTCIFVFGYLVIWALIYLITKKRAERMNEILKKKQQGREC